MIVNCKLNPRVRQAVLVNNNYAELQAFTYGRITSVNCEQSKSGKPKNVYTIDHTKLAKDGDYIVRVCTGAYVIVSEDTFNKIYSITDEAYIPEELPKDSDDMSFSEMMNEIEKMFTGE